MTSIRSQVFDYLKIYPDITLQEVKKEFKDCPKNTIREYYRQFNAMSNNMAVDIRTELIKIIKDYKQPASARVQAIREYNNIVEATPESVEDPLLKLLQTLENDS